MNKLSSIVSLCLYFCSSVVLACSCAFSTLSEKVNLSENIFIVETYNIETTKKSDVKNYSSGQRRGYFKVLDTIKGSSSGMEVISSAEEPVCCMCQLKVKDKTKYLVFNNGGDIHLSTCGFTQEIYNFAEVSETIRAMLMPYKPTENFTGIFIFERQLLLNDDGTQSKVLELERDDYFAEMSRISFEGLRLPSGKLWVIDLQEEQSLSEEQLKVVKERLGQAK